MTKPVLVLPPVRAHTRTRLGRDSTHLAFGANERYSKDRARMAPGIVALHGRADACPKTEIGSRWHVPGVVGKVPGSRAGEREILVPISAMKKLVALGSGALLLGYASAGLSADIVGTIVNPAGAPVPGVTVSVQNRAGTAAGASVSDGMGMYAIHGLVPGTYMLMAKGQSAVVYVADRGVTVDWGIAADSQVIAAARQGTAPPSASVSGKSSMKDLAARQVGAGNSDRSDNAVQSGDCAQDEDGGEQSDDAEMGTNGDKDAQGQHHRHCKHTESH